MGVSIRSHGEVRVTSLTLSSLPPSLLPSQVSLPWGDSRTVMVLGRASNKDNEAWIAGSDGGKGGRTHAV